jgi:hypothetical protein
MKKVEQLTVELIYPDDPGHGVTREKFAKLILAEDLTKIEVARKLPSWDLRPRSEKSKNYCWLCSTCHVTSAQFSLASPPT